MGDWHMPLFYRLKIYRDWKTGQKKRGSIMEKPGGRRRNLKKKWKKMVVMGCAICMFVAVPGITTLADEKQDESVVPDFNGREEFFDLTENDYEESYDDNESIFDIEDDQDSSPYENVFIETDEAIPEIIDNDELHQESFEDVVASGVWTVGDNVTARLVSEGGKNVLYFDSKGGTLWHNWREPVKEILKDVNKIAISESSTVMYLPEDSSFLFADYTEMPDAFLINLEEIDLRKAITTNVKNMSSMLSVYTLKSIDISNFDTSNVTDMSRMFAGIQVEDIDLSGFNTSKVINMSGMFSEAKFKHLDISNFDTSSVKDMSFLFGGCGNLEDINISSFNTSSVTNMWGMFEWCSKLQSVDISGFDTSKVTNMSAMFTGCNMESLDLSGFVTSNVEKMDYMFSDCSVRILDLSGFDTSKVTSMNSMFSRCGSLTELDISGFNTKNVIAYDGSKKTSLFDGCNSLRILKTPKFNDCIADLPSAMCDESGKEYTQLPILSKSVVLGVVEKISIEKASIAGVSLSYGYSGKAYTPVLTIKVNGVTLTKDKDYTVKYTNNKNPGTARIVVTGKGRYTGTKTKTFEIVDCVSSIVSGKTYQLIPKNNSKTAVSSFGGRMINNTKVYITDRSNSEAMKFKAVKNADGTWKFINAKCELALAVQQNSSALGAGLVLYDQTTRTAQNWKLSKKSDNSFAIMNAVTGYSIAMSDASAVKGTTLNMAETASNGLQRFYLAETSAVNAAFDGTKCVRAAKDKTFGLNIASASKTDGANVNLYKYSNANEKKFKIMYSGGGYYRLVNVNSGLCLTVKNDSSADGANVIQSKWAAKNGQRWKIKKNSDGSVTLTNVMGTVLHLTGNKTVNGTNVLVRSSATTTAQRWYLQ